MNQLSYGQYRGILLGLILLMLLGHWLLFVGYLISGDSLYLHQAERYLAGDFSLPASHWGFRYTLVVLLTLIGLLTDCNEWILELFPLLYWVGIFWIMTWFMRWCFGFTHALYAGILVATLPLFVVQSSIAGVDIAEAFFLFAAFLPFYLLEASSQVRYRGYLVAGSFVGLAMLTRETAYGFLLVLGVFFLWGGFRRYLVGLAGAVAVLSLEWAYYIERNIQFTLAVVEGRSPPAHLEPFVSPGLLIVEQKPPQTADWAPYRSIGYPWSAFIAVVRLPRDTQSDGARLPFADTCRLIRT